LNILPPVLLIIALYLATGRAWISFFTPSLLIIAAACVNFFKIQLRGDPFIADDFAHAAEAGKMLSEFELDFNWKIVFCAVYLVLGTVFAALFLKYRLRGGKKRLISSAVAFAVFIGAGIPVYASESIYDSAVSSYEFKWPNPTEEYITRGFVFPFLHSVRGAFPVPPAGYSEAETKAALSRYIYDDIQEGRRVNVISVMLEAFCDLSEYDSIEFETDVYARWHEIQSESVSGNLIANIFAGGTIDTERLFLLGDTSLRDINNKTRSHLCYLREQGYYTEGFHPGDRWFYNRENVHRHLGFENYYFLDDFEDADPGDEYFFSKLLELYCSRDKSAPYFNHSLTIQNHGAYHSRENFGAGMISRGGLTEQTHNILSNYLVGIYDTNERIHEFLEQLRRDEEPVIVALYGDHKPWLGNYESVYDELGISLDTGTVEGFYNMYAVPYVIWANDAAKETLESDFSGDGGDFSPCFLMNRLFSLCSWGGDEFMKLGDAVFEFVPVVNTPTGLHIENGRLTYELSDRSAGLLRELEFAEYYRHRKIQP
ncbi:MAG: LTA synthase family protein, partial [Clostridiales bacterium]|nr:LTA synthase family protein [Clostridiales bacterium]